MNPVSMINLVKRFTNQNGVSISWHEMVEQEDSRGDKIMVPGEQVQTAKVLFIKERFSPLRELAAVMGITADPARYLITLPDIRISKNTIITILGDGTKWKAGTPDLFDIGGQKIAWQIALTEVE